MKKLEISPGNCGNRDSLEIALSQCTTVAEMFQRVSLLADSKSRPFRRIVIPFLCFTFLRSSSLGLLPPLSLSHFLSRELSFFSSDTTTANFFRGLYGNSFRRTETPKKFPPLPRDVSNVLESVKRELNMGISNADRRTRCSDFVVSTYGFPARESLCLYYVSRDPRKGTHEKKSAAPETGPLSGSILCASPFVASSLYHLGSISAEPWKNLPVRIGAINFHFA